MSALLCLPFFYAYHSRYKENFRFYLIIEYLPALVVAALFGKFPLLQSLALCLGSFLAFISLYEIGYLVNDYVSIRWEGKPRLRGVVAAGPSLLLLWSISRLLVFWLVSSLLVSYAGPIYWGFYLFLIVVFAAHNLLRRIDLKVCTFYWLSVFRFLAPNIWVVDEHNFLSLLAAGTILYSGFRLLGYFESKDVLKLPNRKSNEFRLFYYLLPVPLGVADLAIQGFRPLSFLVGYYAACSIASAILPSQRENES